VVQDRGSLWTLANAVTNLRDNTMGKNIWTNSGPVSFSGRTVLHGVSYLGERDVSVDTSVSESETMCVLQVEQVCFKKNRSENLSNYCRIYL